MKSYEHTLDESNFCFLIKEKSLIPNVKDKVLGIAQSRKEIPYTLEELGFKDCKTKLDEYGTLLYYKGKRALYIAYSRKTNEQFN